MSGKKKIFCFNNGGSGYFVMAAALGEDGHLVASHMCSHECYMKHDLGIESKWKHENYNNHYGEGNWELEWVETKDIEKHEGLQKAIELSKTVVQSKENQARVELVIA